jgi:hypothetical protein
VKVHYKELSSSNKEKALEPQQDVNKIKLTDKKLPIIDFFFFPFNTQKETQNLTKIMIKIKK